MTAHTHTHTHTVLELRSTGCNRCEEQHVDGTTPHLMRHGFSFPPCTYRAWLEPVRRHGQSAEIALLGADLGCLQGFGNILPVAFAATPWKGAAAPNAGAVGIDKRPSQHRRDRQSTLFTGLSGPGLLCEVRCRRPSVLAMVVGAPRPCVRSRQYIMCCSSTVPSFTAWQPLTEAFSSVYSSLQCAPQVAEFRVMESWQVSSSCPSASLGVAKA